ncbi:MAG: hypothetical protein RBS53_09005 [Bacteroidales bacterium]|jgi:hypothetical protein|nr:hypothetical protein [Bacteroidales bacterium]
MILRNNPFLKCGDFFTSSVFFPNISRDFSFQEEWLSLFIAKHSPNEFKLDNIKEAVASSAPSFSFQRLPGKAGPAS